MSSDGYQLSIAYSSVRYIELNRFDKGNNYPTVFNLVFRLKYTRWVEVGVAGNVAS